MLSISILEKDILLVEALCGTKIVITQLDGRKLLLRTNKIIDPYNMRIVKDEGMPKKGCLENGDLIIKFNIRFPTTLGEERRNYLKKLLPKCATQNYNLNEYEVKNMEYYESNILDNDKTIEEEDISDDNIGCATQ